MLGSKKIIIGITGSIAAYKTVNLVRLLKKAGACVRVVMSESAQHLVSATTLQALSGYEVSTKLFDHNAHQAMGHIELAQWADLVCIAPATANFIAQCNLGLANDLLTNICLATPAPIMIAPAMNVQMFKRWNVQKNLQGLAEQDHIKILYPQSGAQACGDVGEGRMQEAEDIFEHIRQFFVKTDRLSSVSITITAGPTQESIDPIRFLSNHSSGKMGYALAKAFARQGARVRMISGPVALDPVADVEMIAVTTAHEMAEQALYCAQKSDIFIACAAVADFRVLHKSEQKIKKQEGEEYLTLTLVKNPDIVHSVAQLQQHRPFVVGFAAETQKVMENARNKLYRKGLDMICANDVSQDQVFGKNINKVIVIDKLQEVHFETMSKEQLADSLVDTIIQAWERKHESHKS